MPHIVWLVAVPLAVTTLTGTATVAANARTWFSAGRLPALVSALLLLPPFALPVRACIALFTGPLAGAAIQLVGVHRAG